MVDCENHFIVLNNLTHLYRGYLSTVTDKLRFVKAKKQPIEIDIEKYLIIRKIKLAVSISFKLINNSQKTQPIFYLFFLRVFLLQFIKYHEAIIKDNVNVTCVYTSILLYFHQNINNIQ